MIPEVCDRIVHLPLLVLELTQRQLHMFLLQLILSLILQDILLQFLVLVVILHRSHQQLFLQFLHPGLGGLDLLFHDLLDFARHRSYLLGYHSRHLLFGEGKVLRLFPLLMLLLLIGILGPELIQIRPVLNRVIDCQVDDVFLVSVDYLPDIVGERRHHLLQSNPLVHQDVMMEAGEALLLVEAQLAALFSLDEAVERFRDVHLGVEGLVLFEEGCEETQVALDLFYLAQELFREFGIPFSVLNTCGEVDSLQLQLDNLFIMVTCLLQQLPDIASLMLGIILELPQPIVEGDHAALHLGGCSLRYIFELVDLLTLRILFLGHQLQLLIDALLVQPEVLGALDDLLIQSRFQVVELLDLLFVDLHDGLHLLDLAFVLELAVFGVRECFLYFLVLQLYIGGFRGVLPLQQEIVVLDLLLHGRHVALDLVDLDRLLGLLLIEGLEQIHHDLSDLGLHLVPLKFFDLDGFFLLTHLILFINITVTWCIERVQQVDQVWDDHSLPSAAASSSLSFFLCARSLVIAASQVRCLLFC